MRGRRERELIPHIGFAGLLGLFLDIVSLKRDHACFVDVFVGGENARKAARAVHRLIRSPIYLFLVSP